MALRILIADDHDLVRDGLKPFLEELDDAVDINEAATFNDVWSLITDGDPFDLVLLDLKMPGMAGSVSVKDIIDNAKPAKVVILSGQYEREDIEQTLKDGGSGYIPKTMSGSNITNALKFVLAGQTFVPPEILNAPAADDNGLDVIKGGVLEKLSRRERDILGGVIAGQTNKEIARERDLEEITVKVHLRNVYKKIRASNRADAVRIALENGWTKNLAG